MHFIAKHQFSTFRNDFTNFNFLNASCNFMFIFYLIVQFQFTKITVLEIHSFFLSGESIRCPSCSSIWYFQVINHKIKWNYA